MVKSRKKITIVVIIGALLVLCVLWKMCINKETHYEEHILNFQEMNIEEICQLQKKEQPFFLYVGRESCEYCVYFVHGLSEAIEGSKINIYYLDSVTEYDKSSIQLKAFRDKYDIERVPALIYYEGESVKAKFDVSKGEYDAKNIREFLEENIN